MKNLLFGLIALLFASNISIANVENNSEPSATWPFGCRKWTVGINIGIISATSEVTLCCSPANWRIPPITCHEVRMSNGNGTNTGNVYQYIMINEIEQNIRQKIEGSSIEINSDKIIEENGEKFKLKKNSYPIEQNEKKERFVRVLFEKI
ncbi:MAG: hypothetical protein JNJ52_01305 [Flavobacterium sp.]|nr:hypothetical protein [Flavobacterium sp.]